MKQNSLKISIILMYYKINPKYLFYRVGEMLFEAQTSIDIVKTWRIFVQKWQKSNFLKNDASKFTDMSRGDLVLYSIFSYLTCNVERIVSNWYYTVTFHMSLIASMKWLAFRRLYTYGKKFAVFEQKSTKINFSQKPCNKFPWNFL